MITYRNDIASADTPEELDLKTELILQRRPTYKFWVWVCSIFGRRPRLKNLPNEIFFQGVRMEIDESTLRLKHGKDVDSHWAVPSAIELTVKYRGDWLA